MAEQYPELWIIEPKEATNLIANPSFELGTASWTAVGAGVSLGRSASYQQRGVYSCEVTTASGVASGMYYAASLTAGSLYAFSADVRDVNGQTFNVYFADSAGAAVGTTNSWTGSGGWVRKTVHYTPGTTTNFRVYVTRSAVASTTKYYVDGCQLEAGTVSTYFDGDFNGYNRFRQDYWWLGDPHASLSYRSPRTRSGGSLLRVRDYAKILGIVGMGMPPVTNNAIPVGLTGSQYQNTRVNDRELTVYLRFYGATTDAMYDNRAQITDAIKPDNVPQDEPAIIRYRLDDVNGNPMSETVDVACLYAGGLEDDTSQPASQIASKAAVTFTAFVPMLQKDGEDGTDFTRGEGTLGTVTALYRSPAGAWSAIGTGSTAQIVDSVAFSPSGRLYITQAGTLAGAGEKQVAYWDTSAWTAVGTETFTGFSGGTATGFFPTGPQRIAISAAGSVYVAGNFGTIGTALANNVAYWNGTNFRQLGSGLGTCGTALQFAYGLSFTSEGTLIAAGSFPGRVAAWDGAAWGTLGTTTAGTALYLAVAGTAVTVGFRYAGTPVYRVEQYNGSAYTDLKIGTNSTLQLNGLWATPDGNLFASIYDTAETYPYQLKMYQGKQWRTLLFSPLNAQTYGVSKFQRKLYFSGSYSTEKVNNTTLTSDGIEWRTGGLLALDIDVTSAYFNHIIEYPNGGLVVFGDFSANASTNVTAAVNTGSAKAYPRIFLTGPGVLWGIKNYTTGKELLFDGLKLQVSEKVVLDLRPGRIKFTSSWRGDLMKYAAKGADFDFFLIPGVNNVSLFMTKTGATTTATAAWQPMYWDIAGAMK